MYQTPRFAMAFAIIASDAILEAMAAAVSSSSSSSNPRKKP